MKICLITPLFDPWNVGGAEKYVNTLAHECSKEHDVIVITSVGLTPRKSLEIHPHLKIIEVEQKNISSLYSVITKTREIDKLTRYFWHLIDMFSISSYIQIKKILEKEKPDIIHINGIKGFSLFLFIVLRKLKIPHVLTIHDYGLIYPWSGMLKIDNPSKSSFLERFYVWYIRKISSHITAVIFPSNFIRNYFINFGYFKNSKKYTIYHGTDLPNFTSPKKGLAKEFIYLGRIEKNKGPHIAIQAFKKLKDQNIKLHIVGDGSYIDTINDMASQDKRIIIHGYISHDELDQLLKKSAYGIVPSIWNEPFGLVINELMIKGLPVIASNVGAIPELVKDGHNGFLFNVGDSTSLCKIIEKTLIESTILNKLSQNAILSAKEFSIENQLQTTLEIFKSLAEY